MVGRLPRVITLAIALASAAWQPKTWGHAFLDHGEPRVGAELAASPQQIVLYFDSELEPAFSGLVLEDADGHEIKRSGTQNDAGDPTRLSMPCPPLGSGTYRVRWSVVARDGHRTEGDYTFSVH